VHSIAERPVASNGRDKLVVPHIVTWSAEEELPLKVIQVPGRGIGFADEMPSDRDEFGVLWLRITSCPGVGRPRFAVMHSGRQRQAMYDLLCQVCGQPADCDDEGTAWLLPNYHYDRPGWPNGFTFAEPPTCLSCTRLARQLCPSLRRDHIVVRAGTALLWGIKGMIYQPVGSGIVPVMDELVGFDHPAIGWTLGELLIRQLFDCTPIDLDHADDRDRGGS
jgi:hypothetical protein